MDKLRVGSKTAVGSHKVCFRGFGEDVACKSQHPESNGLVEQLESGVNLSKDGWYEELICFTCGVQITGY